MLAKEETSCCSRIRIWIWRWTTAVCGTGKEGQDHQSSDDYWRQEGHMPSRLMGECQRHLVTTHQEEQATRMQNQSCMSTMAPPSKPEARLNFTWQTPRQDTTSRLILLWLGEISLHSLARRHLKLWDWSQCTIRTLKAYPRLKIAQTFFQATQMCFLTTKAASQV